MVEVQILALICREIEVIKTGIEGRYLGCVRAPEPRQGFRTFDPNSRQMGTQLRGKVEWDGW